MAERTLTELGLLVPAYEVRLYWRGRLRRSLPCGASLPAAEACWRAHRIEWSSPLRNCMLVRVDSLGAHVLRHKAESVRFDRSEFICK